MTRFHNVIKSVTIMSFGPSLFERKLEVDGEIWSLNDCWDLFQHNPDKLNNVTRIYEMHDMEKRLITESAENHIPHVCNMKRWCKRGVRIVMQRTHPTLPTSEAFPLKEIEEFFGVKAYTDYWGLDFWNGTPPYMLAHAVHEGYTKIQMIGVDADEFRHNRQRRTMTYLMGFAKAIGIEVTGLTVHSGHPVKRYGYDYGPEWDAEQNAIACRGWPGEIIWNHLDWRKK